MQNYRVTTSLSYNDLDAHELLWHQEGWCIVCKIDFEIVKSQIIELNDSIRALVKNSFGLNEEETDWDTWSDNIKAKNGDNYITIRQAWEEYSEDRKYWETITNLSKGMENRPNQKSLMNLFAYLLLVEGSYSEIVQILSVLLVDAGHDLFDPIRNDFVKGFGDIEKVDLSIKLKFLEKHGFDLVINSVDRKLRNDIAHLNFRVLEDGKIVDKRNGQEIKGIDEKTKRLTWICTLVVTSLEYFTPYFY